MTIVGSDKYGAGGRDLGVRVDRDDGGGGGRAEGKGGNGEQERILKRKGIHSTQLPYGHILVTPLPLLQDGTPTPDHGYDLGTWRPVI